MQNASLQLEPGKVVNFYLNERRMTQRIMLELLSNGKMYEAETSLAVRNFLKPGDLFVDVGSHVGYFSMLAAASGARVVALEPNPENILYSQRHAAMNGFQFHHLWVAVGSENRDSVGLYHNFDNDGGHTLWDPAAHPFNEQCRRNTPVIIDVQQVTLDFALQQLTKDAPVELLKIDAEGCELDVLKGASQLLWSGSVKNIILEVNEFALNQRGASLGHLLNFLDPFNYSVFLLQSWPPPLFMIDHHQPAVYNLLFSKRPTR